MNNMLLLLGVVDHCQRLSWCTTCPRFNVQNDMFAPKNGYVSSFDYRIEYILNNNGYLGPMEEVKLLPILEIRVFWAHFVCYIYRIRILAHLSATFPLCVNDWAVQVIRHLPLAQVIATGDLHLHRSLD
jgi:hypothetical protein